MDAQERAHNLNPGKFCLWKQGSDFGHSKTCRNIAEQIRQAEQAAREKALEEAAKDVCPYCDGRYPGWPAAEGPNAAGNWTHAAVGDKQGPRLCKASPLYSRLAFESRALKAKP